MSIPVDDRDRAVAHIVEFVDGYASTATRTAYRFDLSLWAAHCYQHGCELLAVRRADIEGYARRFETEGLEPARPLGMLLARRRRPREQVYP